MEFKAHSKRQRRGAAGLPQDRNALPPPPLSGPAQGKRISRMVASSLAPRLLPSSPQH